MDGRNLQEEFLVGGGFADLGMMTALPDAELDLGSFPPNPL